MYPLAFPSVMIARWGGRSLGQGEGNVIALSGSVCLALTVTVTSFPWDVRVV